MRTCITILILMIAALSSKAADGILCVQRSVIATVPFDDYLSYIATHDNLAYVYELRVGIHALDVSDPANPISLAIMPETDNVYSLAAANGLLIVARNSTGILIYDTSDPTNPTLVSTIEHTGVLSDVVIYADRLYYLQSGNLRIADISDPSNPVGIGSYHMGVVTYGMHIANGHAFIAGSHAGLYIIDVSDPSKPVLRHRQDIPGFAQDVTINGSYAYVVSDNGLAPKNGHIRTYDISQPDAPVLLHELLVPGRPLRLEQHENNLYIANGRSVQVLDVSSASAPEPLGMLTTLNNPSYADLAFVGNHLLVPGGREEVEIIDPRAYADPVLSKVTTPPSPQRVSLKDNTLYVANAESGLTIYDIQDKANPKLLSTLDTPGTAFDVAIQQNTALVADADAGLLLLDVTDPSSPQPITTYATQGAARALTTYFGLAYIATDLGLEIVNFTNPQSPFRVSFLSLPKAHHLALGPGVVYVACDDLGLHIVNTLNPATPLPIGYYNENNYNARNITVDANRIFVSNYHNDNNGWLEVFDVTNPANPRVTDIVGHGEDGADFHDGLLYTIQRNELSILDPNTPHDATPIASFPLTHRAGFVHVEDETAYITSPNADTLTIISTAGCNCDADFNDDGQLDVSDITAFLAAYMSQSSETDLNGDSRLNFFDISAFVESFLSGCP